MIDTARLIIVAAAIFALLFLFIFLMLINSYRIIRRIDKIIELNTGEPEFDEETIKLVKKLKEKLR